MEKARPHESNLNRIRMNALFRQTVQDSERFRLIYAYDTDLTLNSFLMVRTHEYRYASYIIGYDPEIPEIVLCVTTPDLVVCCKPFRFKKNTVKKAVYSAWSAQCTIYDRRFKRGYVCFTAPVETDRSGDYVEIVQREAASEFNRFFCENFAKALFPGRG